MVSSVASLFVGKKPVFLKVPAQWVSLYFFFFLGGGFIRFYFAFLADFNLKEVETY